MLDDDLHRGATVLPVQRGVTVAPVGEVALGTLLDMPTAGESDHASIQLPSWDLGEALVDVSDNRELRAAMDTDRPAETLR